MTEQWHYASGSKTTGPVSSHELKRLTAAGVIAPTDLVWKDGMAQWVEARTVRGLFSDAAEAAAPARAADPPRTPPPVVRAAPARGLPAWNPLDRVVAAARAACPEDLAERVSGAAGTVGVHALSLAAVLVLAGGGLLAIRTNPLRGLLTALAASVAILVGQYVASRLLGACQAAITANRSVLASLAVPDCVFVLAAAATITGGLGYLWQAIEGRQLLSLVAALATLVAGGFTALVAITPGGLGIDVDPACRAAEEAVGVFTFLLKAALRSAPILFAAGVAFATYGLLEAAIMVLRADAAGLQAAQGNASKAVFWLFATVAVPIVAYLLMLAYYLTLDVIAAIVSLPGKLDRLASLSRPAEGGGPDLGD